MIILNVLWKHHQQVRHSDTLSTQMEINRQMAKHFSHHTKESLITEKMYFLVSPRTNQVESVCCYCFELFWCFCLLLLRIFWCSHCFELSFFVFYKTEAPAVSTRLRLFRLLSLPPTAPSIEEKLQAFKIVTNPKIRFSFSSLSLIFNFKKSKTCFDFPNLQDCSKFPSLH